MTNLLVHVSADANSSIERVSKTPTPQLWANAERIVEVGFGGQCDWFVYKSDAGPYPIQVRLQDNGVGIPKKNFERIFGLSFTTKPGGAGIGLYLGERLISR